MKCKYCGQYMGIKDIYCSKCGKMSHIVKEQTKGKLFIRLNRIIPIGIVLILIGLCLVSLFIFGFLDFHLVGLPFVIIVIGIIIIVRYKEAIKFSRANANGRDDGISNQKCKYCFSQLNSNGQYCSFCGSKHKANLNE